MNELIRQYRATTLVVYSKIDEQIIEKYYTCSDAREVAKEFLDYLRNHRGIKATDKNIDIYVVATGERVPYDDFKR